MPRLAFTTDDEPGVEAGSEVPGRPNQRQRIIDAALDLMSQQGAGSTSMRQLAKACDLNVAAIYHYFPSKADLLRSVIEERQYGLRMRDLPVAAVDVPPAELLAQLIEEIWVGSIAEERIWRLLLAEAMHGDETALAVAGELLVTLEQALGDWLARLFPDLGDQAEAAAAVIMGQLYATFMERVFVPERSLADVRVRAAKVAALVYPG